ncbi:MAG: AAA family ATPase [bacterium]|nr:AAA family ATPase [bacterium]
MTRDRNYRDELAFEQARNEHYRRCLAEENARRAAGNGGIAMPANAFWTGDGKPRPLSALTDGSLVGRVSFDVHDDDLAYLRDYYVAHPHCDCDESMFVVSWAAELAKPLYLGTGWKPSSRMDARYTPNPEALRARRNFAHKSYRIVAFADDLEPATAPRSVFPRAVAAPAPPPPAPPPPRPSVPAAPSHDTPPRVPAPSAASPPRPPDSPKPVEPAPEPSGDPEGQPGDDESAAPGTGPPDTTESDGESTPPADLIRAHRLVIDSLEAPRSDRLHSVLATLQPDQYRYVTWPATEHLAVQGHPGTGKTIIAAHRAAWLTHAEHHRQQTEHRRMKNVALVGPTHEWASHVSSVLAETGATGVTVVSMETIVRKLAGEQRQPLHRDDQKGFETGWELGRAVDRTVQVLQQRLAKISTSEPKRRRLIFDKIVQNPENAVIIEYPELVEWLRQARNSDHASSDPSYVLLRACIGVLAETSRTFGPFEHMIVDEVQDIRGAEWWIIDRLLSGGGTYSLFGDMNQRRADFTWPSWDVLVDKLELSSSDESTFNIMSLTTGYRSNSEILNYAARLLPRTERTVSALRRGDRSSVDCQRVGPTQVIPRAFERARTLTEEYSDGFVAVISWNPHDLDAIQKRFFECGWRRSPMGRRFLELTPATGPVTPVQKIMLARPVDARGLEFDGVVVVEPADFQRNLGRHGSLYTSLTRANKKLVVIHSKTLPRELKRRT